MPQFGNRPESEPGYCALIGDVVDSRRIDERAVFQNRLQDLIASLNRQHESDLASPLELSSGDEIQGLFLQPQAVVPVAVRLAEDLYPVRIAYGMGYGAVSTEILAHTYQIDGPCFHRARSALKRTRSEALWLTAGGFGDPTDRLINALFQLMHAVRARWTATQIDYIRRARHMLQKEIAMELGRSPSAVSESLQAAAFDAVYQGERALKDLLILFGPRIPPD